MIAIVHYQFNQAKCYYRGHFAPNGKLTIKICTVTGNFHFERYLRPLTYSLSVACRVGRQLTLYYPPELTNRQNQTLQKGKRKWYEAPDRDRQVSVPPVSLSVQVVERWVDSLTAIERVKNGNSDK